ncbi:MAG: lipoprotein [Hyphomicrobiales bacterium]
MPLRLTRLFILALVISALGLTACGRRGDPLPPPGAEDRDPDEPFTLDPLI